MYIELTDDKGQLHRVPAEGAIFGRDPKRCDVVLGDPGVSGVHAKIYLREGRWWLEDLSSSNGTFTGEQQRLTGPLSLTRGIQFSLFRWRFEVTDLGIDEATVNTAGAADPARTAPVPSGAPKTRSAGELARSPTPARPGAAQQPGGEVDGPDGASRSSIGASFAAALAHYVAVVPRLITRPALTVSEGISFQRHSALTPIDLLAWGLPAFALAAILNLLAALAAAAIVGVLVPRLLFEALGIGLSGLVGVAIAAFLWHPVTSWLVVTLGGRSDATSRSNLFVAACAASVVSAAASAVAVTIAALPVPFVGLLSHVFWLLGTVLVLFVLHAWCRHFAVARWFQWLVVLLGLVAVVVTGRTLVLESRDAIVTYRGRQPGVGEAAATTGVVATLPAAAVAQPAPADAGAPPSGAPAFVPAPGTENPPAGSAPASEPPRVPATIPAPEAGAAPAAATQAAKPGDLPTPRPTYAEYVARREALERAIELDPPLLTRVPGLLELYKKLHTELARLDVKYFPKGKRPGPPDVVADRMREAEVYDATVATVIEMDRLIRGAR